MKACIASICAGLVWAGGFITPARADQCAWVGKSQAIAALNYLSIGQTIYNFCELCGDKVPKPILINKLAVANTPDGKLWQVSVNNENIDLAYTYVRYEPKYQVNLAILTKCPADGFTPVLSIKNKPLINPK
jgi:hypothetical protein